MKNLIKFIVLILTTIFIGCVPQNSCVSKLEQKYDSIIQNDSLYFKIDSIKYHQYYAIHNNIHAYNKFITAYKFEYNRHTYIMFSNNKEENGVVHDPDCKCFIK